MQPTPQIPGLTDIQEIGRNQLVIGYRARRGERTLVLEVFRPDPSDEPGRREFFRLSSLQSRLAYPGMPAVIESGWVDGRPYRVREFVEGRPVSGLLTDGPQSDDRLVALAQGVASTLEALHRRRVIHGELCPDSLRVDRAGLFRFLDAGRGLPVGSDFPESQRSMAWPYLAPEARQGGMATPAADVYSLGAMLAAVACGRPPTESIREDFLERRSQPLRPALTSLILTMVASDPSHRPSARGVLGNLVRLDEIDALARLGCWTPEPSEGEDSHHAYPLCGREQEFSRLNQAWQRGPSVVVVCGPPGSGRARLGEELRRAVEKTGAPVSHDPQGAEGGLLLLDGPPRQFDSPRLTVCRLDKAPEGDYEVIELGRLNPSDAVRLAGAYLGGNPPVSLRRWLLASGGIFPGDLLSRLDEACAAGTLRPHWGRWVFDDEKLPETSTTVTVSSRPTPRARPPQAEELYELVSLWPFALEQEQPVPSLLRAFESTLACRHVAILNRSLQLVAASSAGDFPLDLVRSVLGAGEPEWRAPSIVLPLRYTGLVPGVLVLVWWEENFPEEPGTMVELLRAVTAPLAVSLGQSSALTPTELDTRRLSQALEALASASPEPADVLGRLLEALALAVPVSYRSAWLLNDDGLTRLWGDQHVGDEALVDRTLQTPEPLRHVDEANEWEVLGLPLLDENGPLGAALLSRGLSRGFSASELAMGRALCHLATTVLRNARLYGEQSRLLARTRYRFLAAQIRPHFLFNALNTLAALAVVEPEQTEELILDTAEFLRTTFADRPEIVPLTEEIRFLEIYLRLEKARFGKRLRSEIEVPDSARMVSLPVLTLQPLVENAVRHGITVKPEGGTIRLRVEPKDDRFRITIEDDGVGFDPTDIRPTGTGVGLSNVRERLLSHFGEACEWSLRSAPGQGTSIAFTL